MPDKYQTQRERRQNADQAQATPKTVCVLSVFFPLFTSFRYNSCGMLINIIRMSKIPYGISGPVIGKIGSVVGSSWKGVPYIKSIPHKRNAKAGPGEAANRMKFAMAHRWLKPVLSFVREGFRKY